MGDNRHKNNHTVIPHYTYVKRYRMGIDFRETPLAAAGPKPLPEGFCWIPWHPCLVEIHGRVKFQSFHGSGDALIFPSFQNLNGCVSLMYSIANSRGFIPGGTWLIAKWKDSADDDDTDDSSRRFAASMTNGRNEYALLSRRPDSEPLEYVGTIQGIARGPINCDIQNVAIRPEYRRLGLGRALLMKALQGFYASGFRVVCLEATASNTRAVHLYQSVGFQIRETLYKEVFTHHI